MQDQLTLLEQTQWDVLVVLDACRADVFSRVAPAFGMGPRVGQARSPAVCTPGWLGRVKPLLRKRKAAYFSANPVVDRELGQSGLRPISIWKDHWGRFTRLQIPSVHPLSVNGVVLTYRRLGLMKGQPWVVHYLQPHSPYIGVVPLAMARWGGRCPGPLGRACRRLTRPDVAAGKGRLDWRLLRRAYRANLELACDAVRQLRASLPGTMVVTSDHGELLGEPPEAGAAPAFGHECHWDHPLLRRVPWVVLPQDAAPRSDDEGAVRGRLRALGYLD